MRIHSQQPGDNTGKWCVCADSYEPAATTIHLSKNPYYYDADKIALSGLHYQVIQDSQQALMSYQTGALDTTLINGEQVDR